MAHRLTGITLSLDHSLSDFDQSFSSEYRYYLRIQSQLIRAQTTLNDWLYILTVLALLLRSRVTLVS